jgi:alcohol dehydrogenase (NADP+)
MGATKFIATDEDRGWAEESAGSVDLIVSTVSSPKLPLEDYLRLLRVRGTFIQVGVPEDPLPSVHGFSLIGKGVKIGGSMIGSPREVGRFESKLSHLLALADP